MLHPTLRFLFWKVGFNLPTYIVTALLLQIYMNCRKRTGLISIWKEKATNTACRLHRMCIWVISLFCLFGLRSASLSTGVVQEEHSLIPAILIKKSHISFAVILSRLRCPYCSCVEESAQRNLDMWLWHFVGWEVRDLFYLLVCLFLQ